MAEPVTLAEAKAQCRMVEDDSEDTFIDSLRAPARAYVERVSGYILNQRAFTTTFPAWGDYLSIWRRPLVSVDEVAYVDEAGEAATYEGFLENLTGHPARIYPGVDSEFPGLADGGSVAVTYTAGFEDGSDDEAYLIGKRAILILIGHWFEHREAAVIGAVSSAVEFTVNELLNSITPISAY
jgi:uncharacterized phiE125 gp8 family phage protein